MPEDMLILNHQDMEERPIEVGRKVAEFIGLNPYDINKRTVKKATNRTRNSKHHQVRL